MPRVLKRFSSNKDEIIHACLLLLQAHRHYTADSAYCEFEGIFFCALCPRFTVSEDFDKSLCPCKTAMGQNIPDFVFLQGPMLAQNHTQTQWLNCGDNVYILCELRGYFLILCRVQGTKLNAVMWPFFYFLWIFIWCWCVFCAELLPFH